MTSFTTESTDASGYRHWRWYVVSASSSYWRAVWATIWECTALLTRTIISQPITSVEVTTTTIINGATTTLIWGTKTSIFTNGGGGVSPPTFVPAVTTDSNGDVTTLFSLAAQTGTGGEGIVSPTGTPVAGNIKVSGSTFAFTSTGDAGVLPPIPTPSAVVSTIVSSGNAHDGGEGVIPPPSTTNSSGSGNITISGSTYTSVSTGLDGVITPTVTTAIGNSSVSTSPPDVVISAGSFAITISGSTAALQSTGGEGAFSPVLSTNISLGISVAATSGEASFATSSSTLTSYSNGDSGISPPGSTSSVPSAGNQTTVTPSPTGGSFNVTVSGSTALASSTGDSGVLPPLLSNDSSIISATPVPSQEIVISIGVGTVEFSTSSSTATTVSIEDNGIIPPLPTNVSTSSLQSLEPTPSFNFTSTGGTGNISIQASTAATFSTGGEGILPPLSSPTSSLNLNSSSETPSNPTVSVSTTSNLEATSSTGPRFSNTDAPRTSFFDSSISVANSTTPSASPTPNLNSSSTGPPFTNTGADWTPFFSESTPVTSGTLPPVSVTSTSSLIASSTGPPFTNSGADRTPFFNETTSMPISTSSPASITPSPSFNVSFSLPGPPFNNSAGDRTHNIFSSTLSNLNIPATSPTDSALVSTPTVSASMSSSFVAIVTTTVSVFVLPFANVTGSILSSGILTGVTPSVNNTSPPTETPTVSSGILLPPNNTTSSSHIGTPVVPPVFGNSTVPFGSGFSASTVPSATPSVPFYSTEIPPFPTGNSSIPLPTPTGYVSNSTTLDICPTAPIIITVTSVQTSVQVQISTLTETVTAGAVSTSASSSSTSSASSPADLDTEDRRAGQLATQPQIDVACANPDNVVTNPNFTMSSDNTVAPWTVDNLDPTITVGSEQDPNSNGTIAQFRSAVVGRTLTITQPLTLCPGQQNELSSMNRQANTMAGCTAQYRIGNHTVYTVTPQTTWLQRSEYFTAGPGVEGASVDLQITASCSGYAGMPVTDQAGWMRVDISAVSVVLYDVVV
ncbi:hypothetical protein L13192_10449 [Pyrenophora tritici-repentis]|nr:hypothetical protein L13192_10449 [Pyrenophora tritici-repentis]